MGRVRIPLVAALVIALAPALAFAYTLGPGDQISIDVRAAQTQLSLSTAVSIDGRISVAPVGALVAEGKTPAELEAELARELSRYYAGPVQVAVLVAQPKQVRVFVLGQVQQPGEQSLLDSRPLLSQAIAKAGGAAPQAATRRVSLVRGGRELGPIDLHAILKLGRSELDAELHAYDRIFVPARDKWVTVLGPVQAPGIYEMLPGDRVSNLILMAGGLSSEADQERAVIERHRADAALGSASGRSGNLEVNLRAALDSPGGAQDPLLEPTDIVRLSIRASQVYVLGQVAEPGAKPYQDNLTLLDYIGLAGGIMPRARPHNVVIVRPASVGAHGRAPLVFPVDLADLMSGKAGAGPPEAGKHAVPRLRGPRSPASSGEVALQPGDIILVPERRIASVQDWTSIAQVISTLLIRVRVF